MEEFFTPRQAWGEVKAEVFYFWQIIWMDLRTKQFCTGVMVSNLVGLGKTPETTRSMADWGAEEVAGKGREGEDLTDLATRGVGGVAGQGAVIAWHQTLLFLRWGVQVVADK